MIEPDSLNRRQFVELSAGLAATAALGNSPTLAADLLPPDVEAVSTQCYWQIG